MSQKLLVAAVSIIAVAIGGVLLATPQASAGRWDDVTTARCSCSCTSQGVLLQRCDGNTTSLGDYGSLAKCGDAKKTHPGCR